MDGVGRQGHESHEARTCPAAAVLTPSRSCLSSQCAIVSSNGAMARLVGLLEGVLHTIAGFARQLVPEEGPRS